MNSFEKKAADIRRTEVNYACRALWSKPLEAFLCDICYPEYLEGIEEFTDTVFHFTDDDWKTLTTEIKHLAAERGVKVEITDDTISILGSNYSRLRNFGFKLNTFGEDIEDMPVSAQNIEGMTRDEAIEYLNTLPDCVEPFNYVEFADHFLDHFPTTYELQTILDCILEEPKIIKAAEQRAELKIAKEARRQAKEDGAYKKVKQALINNKWTGKFIVEHGYGGVTLMIPITDTLSARCRIVLEDMDDDLRDFIEFCRNFPNVKNPQAYQLRTSGAKKHWDIIGEK